MKKERIVVLCLCVMLSGAIHTQWIAWAWQHALHSPRQAVGPIRAGKQAGTAPNTLHFSAPSNVATALACAAWLPLGILYSEAIVVGKKPKTMPDEQQTPEQNSSLTMHHVSLRK